ncbi:MAG: hypothetical protein H6606_03165 [Flavobacteriales bacterium]|nr:hypothetical protein [Flavobacteriales bacterium]
MNLPKLVLPFGYYLKVASYFIAILLLQSCLRDQKQWTTEISAPLFKTDLGLDDLFTDSLLIENSDGSYVLSYEYEYAIDSFGDYLNVPDTISRVTVSLQKLVLSDKTISDTITLREMAPETGLIDGKTVDLPAQEFKDAGGQEIDISKEFFQEAKFRNGFLDLVISNDLPVEVEELSFELRNKSDGTVIANGIFKNILPGEEEQQSYDLSGKEVKGILIGEIIQVKTKASNGQVLVDADKGVRITMNVRDLEPEYATAIFPAQDLVQDTQEVVYDLGNAMVTEMMIRSGQVIMTVHSTIEEEITLDYRIPFSGLNGDFSKPLIQKISIPPAPPGSKKIVEKKFPLDGYVIVYKGKDPLNPPFYNTVYSELKASIVYSGLERSISLNDSVFIEFGFVDIEPEYAYGDFGYKEFNFNEEEEVKVLKDVQGSINFEDMWMNLLIENAFGIQANVTFNSITSINERTGNTVALQRPGLMNEEILLNKAFNPPFQPFRRSYVLNGSNSNVKQFMENIPNKIGADIRLVSRPYGSNDLTDFVFRESYLKAILRLNIPVQFNLGNLRLTQKQAFNFEASAETDRIRSGKFRLKVLNDFPISAALQIDFLDEEENILHSLFNPAGTIEGAEVPSGSERSIEPRLTYLTHDLGPAEIELIKNAVKVRTTATLNSPDSKRYKIFSDYQMSILLSGEFEYDQNF